MLVEILSVTLKKGIVEIQALDVSEENLSRMERMRDDMNNPELTFLLDTREEKVLMYLIIGCIVRKRSASRNVPLGGRRYKQWWEPSRPYLENIGVGSNPDSVFLK